MFRIILHASKAGSIGAKYNIRRQYEIRASNQDDAQNQARNLAYEEGLEHTLITVCTPINVENVS